MKSPCASERYGTQRAMPSGALRRDTSVAICLVVLDCCGTSNLATRIRRRKSLEVLSSTETLGSKRCSTSCGTSSGSWSCQSSSNKNRSSLNKCNRAPALLPRRSHAVGRLVSEQFDVLVRESQHTDAGCHTRIAVIGLWALRLFEARNEGHERHQGCSDGAVQRHGPSVAGVVRQQRTQEVQQRAGDLLLAPAARARASMSDSRAAIAHTLAWAKLVRRYVLGIDLGGARLQLTHEIQRMVVKDMGHDIEVLHELGAIELHELRDEISSEGLELLARVVPCSARSLALECIHISNDRRRCRRREHQRVVCITWSWLCVSER